MSRTVFPLTRTLRPGSGDTLYDVGFLLGLFLWAFGSLWLFFAAASIIRSKKFPFNLGWWAFTFPLGVYSTCTCQLGREMPSRFFAVLGTVCYPMYISITILIFQILSLSVVLLWLIVSAFTVKGIYNRSLFVAPCLAELHKKQKERTEGQKK